MKERIGKKRRKHAGSGICGGSVEFSGRLKKASDKLVLALKKLGTKGLAESSWLMTGSERLEDARSGAERRGLKNTAVCALLALAVVMLYSLISSPQSGSDSLTRPSFGDGSAAVTLTAEVKSGKQTYSEERGITVQEKDLSFDDAQALFSECFEWLCGVIPGDSPDLDHISSDLVLPDKSPTGIMLGWESSDPALIDGSGLTDLWGSGDGDRVTLYCTMLAKGFSSQFEFELTLMPSLCSFEQRAASAVRKEAGRLSDSSEGDSLDLSKEDSPVIWSEKRKKNTGAVAMVLAMLVLMVWTSRFSSLKSELKKREAAFSDGLSDVTSQLVLYLEAGLICSTAFRQLREQNPPSKGQLYKAIGDLQDESDSSNAPFVNLFYRYAVSSANRDFIRLAQVIRESSDHGSELTEKLKRENSRIRDARLSSARGRAKETETKLCMPLMLLLISLLLITAGPVFIGL